jgi:hypothetical protein
MSFAVPGSTTKSKCVSITWIIQVLLVGTAFVTPKPTPVVVIPVVVNNA